MPNPAPPPPAHPAPKSRPFHRRFLGAVFLSGALISASLGLGVLGYHFVANLNWIDALLNASMILTGMGPVNTLGTTAAKLFASAYALFSGLILISASGILLTPIFHRVLHRFHIEERDLK